MDDALKEWFVREILPHEAALTRCLARACPNSADVLDIRHDIYIKVIEAAGKSRPLSPKSFLFTTTRNLITDRVRRGRIVSIDLLEDLDQLNVLIDEVSPERFAGAREQLSRLSGAFDELPDRSREVMWMKKIEGLSQKDIARRLKISEGTVEWHLVQGMKQLTRLFYGAKPDAAAELGAPAANRGVDHEQ